MRSPQTGLHGFPASRNPYLQPGALAARLPAQYRAALARRAPNRVRLDS